MKYIYYSNEMFNSRNTDIPVCEFSYIKINQETRPDRKQYSLIYKFQQQYILSFANMARSVVQKHRPLPAKTGIKKLFQQLLYKRFSGFLSFI